MWCSPAPPPVAVYASPTLSWEHRRNAIVAAPAREPLSLTGRWVGAIARLSFPLRLSLAFGVLYLLLAWWLYFPSHVWLGDAVARTANGVYAVLSRDRHLAAIGFVWLPGPTIVQLPFILLLDAGRAPLFAGNLMSVISAAATVLVLWRLLERLQVPPRYNLALVALYALNPMTLFYAANGMSEAPFVSLVLLVIWQYLE